MNYKDSGVDIEAGNAFVKRIKEKLNGNKFFYIKKKLSKDEYDKLWWLGNKSIQFDKKQTRYYPQKNLFSHVVGQIDEDNRGISGVEIYFDEKLKTEQLIISNDNFIIDGHHKWFTRKYYINSDTKIGNINNKFINVRYRWGGKHFSGIDCSGLIQICLKLKNTYIVEIYLMI